MHREVQKVALPRLPARMLVLRDVEHRGRRLPAVGCDRLAQVDLWRLHMPPVVPHDADGKGDDLAVASATHVNRALERLRVHHGAGRKLGILERGLGTLRDHGCLHHGELADSLLEALGHRGGVLLRRLRKGRLLKPHPREGMSLHQHDERSQADGLETRRIQAREVEAGGHVLAEHRVGHSDALARAEARGRAYVHDALLLQGAKQRRRLHPHPVRVSRLIAVERRAAGPLLQNLRRPYDDGGKRGMVGRYERRQGLGGPKPLVKREEDYLAVCGCKRFSANHDVDSDVVDHALRKLEQTLGVHRHA